MGDLCHNKLNVDLPSIVIVKLVILNNEHRNAEEISNNWVIGATKGRAVFPFNCTSNPDAISPRYLHGLNVNV